MGDGINSPITVEDFIAVVGKNYIAPHRRTIPNGTGYVEFTYSRPVLLVPLSPSTTGIVYAYPGGYPADDRDSIQISAGQPVYLDARGKWYVRTSSSSTETFLVIDAGGAANAQAIAQSVTPGASNANSDAPVTWTTSAPITVNAADTSVLAANTSRRGLSFYNSSTGGQVIAITTENPATAANRGVWILQPGQGITLNPHDCPPTAALRAFASAASGTLTVAEGI